MVKNYKNMWGFQGKKIQISGNKPLAHLFNPAMVAQPDDVNNQATSQLVSVGEKYLHFEIKANQLELTNSCKILLGRVQRISHESPEVSLPALL